MSDQRLFRAYVRRNADVPFFTRQKLARKRWNVAFCVIVGLALALTWAPAVVAALSR